MGPNTWRATLFSQGSLPLAPRLSASKSRPASPPLRTPGSDSSGGPGRFLSYVYITTLRVTTANGGEDKFGIADQSKPTLLADLGFDI